MRHERIREKNGIRGMVTVRSHPAGTIAKLEKLIAEGRGEEANRLIRSGRVQSRHHNLVVYSANLGYDLLVQWVLANVSWGEIGTGTAQPTVNDTALTAPVSRAPMSYSQDSGYNKAVLQFFYPDAVLANQTYYEFGSYAGGTSTLGSGPMFNHALFTNPYSKSAGSDTTVEVDFSFAIQNAAEFDDGEFT